MATNRVQLKTALHKPYDRLLFAKEVLHPVFGSCFELSSPSVSAAVIPNKSESVYIDKVWIYGNILLEDRTNITCYEILLQPKVRLEQSKVAIQHYVRKLLIAGQAALINFIAPVNKNVWRLTLVAKSSEVRDLEIKEKTTHAKRYTFLLGPSESCKTAAERFEVLSTEKIIDFDALERAFSVEKLSKAFFDEYTQHYNRFCDYLQDSAFRKSIFNISLPTKITKEEKDAACKPIRDFTKKLLGRIVFLYFVQKKGWLGASNTDYKDGINDFMMYLFKSSGANDSFYPNWLSNLFFETLNSEEGRRKFGDFIMPDGKLVKIPYLNGGLFDKEDYDEHILTIKSKLFHNPDNSDDPKYRGFLDFLNSFNFTVYEDSPDDHTIAVDPEMLGHIFENLLEDNKDKGAFYTPKEIVHYMCQESLIEYLTTHLQSEYTIYKVFGDDQIEIFGNEIRTGQQKLLEQLGDQAINRADVEHIVKHKNISKLTRSQLNRMGKLLDTVKICDPAIGSGAFPMGMLQEIFGIKELIAYETAVEWKPAEVKLNIIQNSIYGVDIEKGAVDIARLRFWLSLVVDEEKPKALPNLDYKIVVGDSLISKIKFDENEEIVEIDWNKVQHTSSTKDYIENIHRLLKEISEKQIKFFNPENKNKKRLATEIRNLKLELLINQLSFNKELYLSKILQKGGFFPTASDIKFNTERELKISGFDKLIFKLKNLQNNFEAPFYHFDWKLDFPEVLNPYLTSDEKNQGFDVVIGNPPYIDHKRLKHVSQSFKKFDTFIGTADIYVYFYEKGINLLKNRGILSFITSNKWMRSEYGKLLRRYFINYVNPLKLIDFGTNRVFDATVDSNIIIVEKSKNERRLNVCGILKSNLQFNLSEYINSNLVLKPDFTENAWLLSFGDNLKFKERIEKIGIPLKKFPINIYRGLLTGLNDAFFITGDIRQELIDYNSKNKEILVPILRGKDIDKYCYHFDDLWLINSHNGIKSKNLKPINLKKDYPEIFNHLKKFLPAIADRSDQGNHWSNLRNCAYLEEFKKEKILWQGVAKRIVFSYANDDIYSDVTTFFMTGDNLKFLLSIFNSKFFEYILLNIYLEGDTFKSKNDILQNFPIPKISEKEQKPFVTIVDYILFLKNNFIAFNIDEFIFTYFEQIIDSMVYELYFPDILQKHNNEIIKYLGDLPEIDIIKSDKQKMSVITQVYNHLNESGHTVNKNLVNIKTLPEISIIEGIK